VLNPPTVFVFPQFGFEFSRPAMTEKLKVDTRMTVETPEGVDFQFVIAGPGKRAVSFALDTAIKGGVIAIGLLLLTLYSASNRQLSEVGMGMVLILWFSMSWLYGSCCEAFLNGRTPGKISQGLRVVRTNGTPIGWFEAFGRNLLLVADGFLVFGPLALNTVALISMASTNRMQRLGDLLFDTMVIDESREFISRSTTFDDGVEEIRRAECKGRYHVPERTLAVIERLFEGDRLISDGRREEIARSLSLVLRERLGFEDAPPDPRNPNTFFAQSPKKHTEFLKRVFRTFSDDGQGDSSNDAPGGRKPRRARSTESETFAASMSLDNIVADAAAYEQETAANAATAVLEPDEYLMELSESDLVPEDILEPVIDDVIVDAVDDRIADDQNTPPNGGVS